MLVAKREEGFFVDGGPDVPGAIVRGLEGDLRRGRLFFLAICGVLFFVFALYAVITQGENSVVPGDF